VYSGDHPVAGRWGVHIEAQVRRDSIITKWDRLLFRNGVNYKLNDSVVLSAGHFYIRKFPTGDFSPSTAEHRIYEQASFSENSGAWTLGHRVRFEQLFEEGSYQNRLRYRFETRRGLSRSYFLRLSAEPQVRFGFNSRGRTFDQLRLYSAIGRKLSRYWSMETGYMYQYIVPQFGNVFQSNHILRIEVTSKAPL